LLSLFFDVTREAVLGVGGRPPLLISYPAGGRMGGEELADPCKVFTLVSSKVVPLFLPPPFLPHSIGPGGCLHPPFPTFQGCLVMMCNTNRFADPPAHFVVQSKGVISEC
jgi:hypothetical protein